ncbi:MAG: response regulator [Verrucomicrobiota bacterium]
MAEIGVDVLILEPDEDAAAAIGAALPARLHRAFVNSIPEAEDFMNCNQPRLFLCADDMPGETGLMFLARTEQRWPGMKRVLVAADLDGELFFHAMREVRIFSYLSKPVDRGELIRTVHHALLDRGAGAETSHDKSPEGPSEMPQWLRLILVAVATTIGGLVVLVVLLSVFGVCYEAKSLAGVDVFPGWHLVDLLRR